jgi:hypothetical protein
MGTPESRQMATKRRKGRPGPPRGPCEVRVTMQPGPHQTLREEAAKRGMSMSAYAAALVLEGLGYDRAPAPRRAGQGGDVK